VYEAMNDGAGIPTVVLHPVHPPGLSDLLAEQAGITVDVATDDNAVVDALEAGAEVLVTYRWEHRYLTASLRWVQAISAGIEQFPVDEFRARGVRLTSARGAHAPAVAEHALALLFILARRIGEAMRDVPDRRWHPYRPAYELSGRTLGILGLGTIGEEIAVRASGLGMRVVGSKRRPDRYEGVAEWVGGPDGTLEVCREADVVVITLPHAEDTIGLVGPEELEALRGGWLVNVGRGSVVDEPALITALADGTLLGAGLDVFAAEPLPADSPLWDLPNVVITPHSAWSSDRLAVRLADLFGENLAAFRGSGNWRNLVV
jgi:phosphoglycerate dehydrogenase-like enzyme